MQTEDKIRRFDDVFRTLLIVGTILFSFNTALQRGKIMTATFVWYVILFSMAVIFWCFGTLHSALETEYKIIAWFGLVTLILSSYLMIFFQGVPTPQFVVVVSISYAISLRLFWYLSPDRKRSRTALFLLTWIWLNVVLTLLAEPLITVLTSTGLSAHLVPFVSYFLMLLLATGVVGMFWIVFRKPKHASA